MGRVHSMSQVMSVSVGYILCHRQCPYGKNTFYVTGNVSIGRIHSVPRVMSIKLGYKSVCHVIGNVHMGSGARFIGNTNTGIYQITGII